MKYIKGCIAAVAVFIAISCNNNNDSNTNGDGYAQPSNVQNLSYNIAGAYPHDTSSFTEGLEFYKGKLYESTGNLAKSKLLEIDLQSGKAAASQALAAELFGEGITILNDTLYQLTWQNRLVLVYDVTTMKKIGELPLNTDGWGMTNDGKALIVSDGSSNLYFYEPRTFRLLRTQGVTLDGAPVSNINELEFINGFVYANQWQYPYILKIDPQSGQVVARMDFTELINRVQTKIPNLNTGTDATLNGIAYNDSTNKVYITGKYWPELYEVQFER